MELLIALLWSCIQNMGSITTGISRSPTYFVARSDKIQLNLPQIPGFQIHNGPQTSMKNVQNTNYYTAICLQYREKHRIDLNSQFGELDKRQT